MESGCRPAAPRTSGPESPRSEPAAESLERSEAIEYTVLLKGRPVGTQRTKALGHGQFEVEFDYKDRGRGPSLRSRIETDELGLLRRLSTKGHDYLGAAVDESFERGGGRWTWAHRGDDDSRPAEEPAFYLSLDAVPEETALLAAAALAAAGGKLPLVPSGVVEASVAHTLDVAVGDESRTVSGIRLDGLGFSPVWVWLRPDRRLFARVTDWLSVVEAGWQDVVPTLVAKQDQSDAERRQRMATTLGRRRPGGLAVRGVAVFDARAGTVVGGQTVVVRDNRFATVGPAQAVAIPEDAQVIDGRGRTMVPGLWDMHSHYSPDDGILHIAAGVTTIRDLANDEALVREESEAIGAGRAIGPRIVAAGIIDGPGPYAGPTPVLVDTPDEARAAVNRYADLGYPQVKIYSSVSPKLVPVIVERARERGLRVSGHVPAFMTAEQAVRAGYDELQHINFLVLNFLDPDIDTRTPARFTAVAEQAGDIGWDGPAVRDFIRLLAERGVVVDPTVTIFEGMFTARPGRVSPVYEAVAARMPLPVARRFRMGGLPLSSDEPDAAAWARRERSFAALLQLIGRLDQAGVQIVAGTDALAGFTLHRELENYVRAGLPAARVLQLATMESARVMGVDQVVGTIEPGRKADFVLVEGDPLQDMSALRDVVVTCTDGTVFHARELEAAVGMKPR